MTKHQHHTSLHTLGVEAEKAFKPQASGTHQQGAQHGNCAGAWPLTHTGLA